MTTLVILSAPGGLAAVNYKLQDLEVAASFTQTFVLHPQHGLADTFNSREALKESEADKQYGWVLAGHLRLTALSRSVRSDSKPAGTQYYFDFNDDKEKREVGGAEVIVALFSRWETFSSGKIQWRGLLFERVVHGKDRGVGMMNETRYKRVGVYMGDLRKLRRDTGSERVTEDVGLGFEWERQEFVIV